MPPLPVVPNVARFTFQQLLGEDANIVNRVYASYTGTPTNAICLAWAVHAAAEWNTYLAPLLCVGIELNEVECLDLSTTLGTVGVAEVSDTGTQSAAPMPAQVCLNMRGHVTRRYRGGHPRWYQSGLPESDASDQQSWTTTVTNGWGTAFNGFVNNLVSFSSGGVSGVTAVNVSYYNGFENVMYPSGRYKVVPQLRSTPLVDAIVNWTADQKFGSQRRRRVLPLS